MSNFIQEIILFFSKLFNKEQKTIPEQVLPAPSPSIPEAPKPTNDLKLIGFPDRNPQALSGSKFGTSILNVPAGLKRDNIIANEINNGNVPDFMRAFKEVEYTSGNYKVKIFVSQDVLCVGTDDDFLRVSLTPLTAKKIADKYNCVLPTKKLADVIWKAADVKLNPDPNGPPYDATMQTTERLIFHNDKIEKQRQGRTGLISGHKKDVVICKKLLSDPSRVAIYGWFFPTGSPIQGLNAVSHEVGYQDYSHGIRLISRTTVVNGQIKDFYEILKNPNISSLLSDEGYFDATNIYKT